MKITLGAGRRTPTGKEVEAPDIKTLARAIENHVRKEAWWSPHRWEGSSRAKESSWIGSSLVGVDVDNADAKGKHSPLSPDLRAELEQALAEGRAPGNLGHVSPRGVRLVFDLGEELRDEGAWKAAAEGACALAAAWIASEGWPSLSVDTPAVLDCKRFLWTPCAHVDGLQRDARLHVMREAPYPAASLRAQPKLEAPPLSPPPQQPPKLARPAAPARVRTMRPPEEDAEFLAAIARYNSEHPIALPPNSAPCPICGDSASFGELPDSGRWSCFSTDHPTEGPGAGLAHKSGRQGDALDLGAHAAGLTRAEVLRAEGYLPMRPVRAPLRARGERAGPVEISLEDLKAAYARGEWAPKGTAHLAERPQKAALRTKPRPPRPPAREREPGEDDDLPEARAAPTAADLDALERRIEAQPEEEPPLFVPNGAGFKLTETGLAERLHAQRGEDLHYVPDWKRWLVWDGRRWAFDRTCALEGMSKATVRTIYEEAYRTEDDEIRKAIVKFAQKSESSGARRAMIKLSEAEPGIACTPEVFDADSWSFNIESGTLNLRTGELRPHSRADKIRKLAPVPYTTGAQCPTWLAFLERVLPDAETRAFVQRAVGYSLTGETTEHVLFVLWGSGRNGKSTFVEALRGMMGDYSHAADFSTFVAQKNKEGAPRNDLAALVGARFVSAVESEEGSRLAESFVKAITGGDMVSARFLFAEFFEFIPTFKPWLATNHKPQIRGTDEGIWRRIRLIPFTVTIPHEEMDKELPSKLRAERPGILAWALEGCRLWQRAGLNAPAQVLAATAAYRRESDVVGTFIEERCHVGKAARVPSGALLRAYESWAKANGEEVLSAKGLKSRLEERGFSQRKSMGRMEWPGIGLLAEESGEE